MRILGAVLALALVQPAAAQTVGTAAAVNPQSTAAAPRGSARVLRLGDDVVFRHRIVTSASGSLQVLFVDKTTLNVGPGSDLTVDEFVYDPAGQRGRMAATLSRGVLRFVGGNTSHTGGASLRTPVAVIGIRGGVATVRHDRAGTRAVLHFGTMTVTSAGGSTVVRRPGFTVAVGPDGSLGGPNRVAQAEVDATLGQTLSRPGQRGGARIRPADAPIGLAAARINPCTAPVQGQTVADLRSPCLAGGQPREADDLARRAAQDARDFPTRIPIDIPRDVVQPMPTTPTVPTFPTAPTGQGPAFQF